MISVKDGQNQALENLKNRWWRLNNLYYIVDRYGQKTLFRPNWAQHDLYTNVHYCNVVLKARQLGMSTFITILFLDACLFNSNVSAGIIAHTREDAKTLFKKVRFAYENLPETLRSYLEADTDSANELVFSNGSSIRVGTSMRSSSLQYLHISEFGKICRKYPEKANEIITGSLNTVAPGQFIFIESTAEGREGHFYDICQQAMKNTYSEVELSELDFKFHFYPWWKHPDYVLNDVSYIIPQEDLDYFEELQGENIQLNAEQRVWYSKKRAQQGEGMRQEYPSTPEESFYVSTEGLYYGKQMRKVYEEKRIAIIPYDPNIPVYTAWDLGFSDSTAIWFFQMSGHEIRLIDYYEACGEALTHYIKVVKEKAYCYEKHFAPHDIQVHEYSTGISRYTLAWNHGLQFHIAPKLSIQEGIDAVRNLLHKCWFDGEKCAQGIKCLENYTKKWNESLGAYSDAPLHNHFSHGADSFRMLAVCIDEITGAGMTEAEAMRLESMYRR